MTAIGNHKHPHGGGPDARPGEEVTPMPTYETCDSCGGRIDQNTGECRCSD